MPKASIAIPCYNAVRHIEQTVASALAQTMGDFELVLVNDGSTDGTLELLERLASTDPRILVIDQPNGGEGVARDAGRAACRGEWLYFLDSDDLMEPTLLEEAIARGEETDADLVVFRTQELDDQTGELRYFHWCFDVDWIGTDVFDPHEHPQRILNSFQNWVHNKLWRASFVQGRGLRFQHVHRTADLLFTCRALTEAHRIALLDRPLHRYRVNNPGSALFTSDSYPLDFYDAFVELRDQIDGEGTWELYGQSFVNWVTEGVAMNLQRARSLEGFSAIYQKMHDEGLRELRFDQLTREDAINPDRWDRCEAILELPLDELLFRYFALEKEEVRRSQTDLSFARLGLDALAGELECVTGSASFKIGRAITSPLRAFRDVTGGTGR